MMERAGLHAPLLGLAALALLAACAGDPPPKREKPPARVRWNARGVERLRHGDTIGARLLFHQALNESRAVDDLASEAAALRNLARVHEREGARDAARQRYAEALGLYERLDRWHGADLCRAALAHLDILDGQLDDATRRLEVAETAQRARDDRAGLAITWNHQGLIALGRDDPTTAHARFRQAEEALREAERLDDLGATIANRGEAARRLERWDEAAAAFEEALSLARQREDREGIALGLRSLATLAEARGEPAEALGYYRRALRVNESMGASTRAEADRQAIERLEATTHR